MSDIVEKLRARTVPLWKEQCDICEEAANRIERLEAMLQFGEDNYWCKEYRKAQAEIERLRTALRIISMNEEATPAWKLREIARSAISIEGTRAMEQAKDMSLVEKVARVIWEKDQYLGHPLARAAIAVVLKDQMERHYVGSDWIELNVVQYARENGVSLND